MNMNGKITEYNTSLGFIRGVSYKKYRRYDSAQTREEDSGTIMIITDSHTAARI
jgi:hypothetical protein